MTLPAQDPLAPLVDEQLSAVVFVQDYLQLDFDDHRLTVNVWPVVKLALGTFKFGDAGYRDALCMLIGNKVVSGSETESEITIGFDAGQLAISLVEESSIERVVLDNKVTHAWSWW